MKVAIIADDLTGALDAAAPFVRAGRSAAVVTRADALVPYRTAADVVSVNTNTRDADAETAGRNVADAVRSLDPPQGAVLFKKIDSTLRGQVVAETLGVLKAMGRRRAVVCPAVPAQGRIVREGRVYVHGKPLSDWLPEGEVKRWGPRGSLPELFASSSDGFEVDFPAAANDADLAIIAAGIRAGCGDIVAAGASGLAAALAGAAIDRPQIGLEGPFLFAIGSRARETAAQMARLADLEVPTVAVPSDSRAALPEGGNRSAVLIHPDHDAIPERTHPMTVVASLADAVAAAIDVWSPRTMVLSGGDTASAVLDHLGSQFLRVVGEVEAGVPVSETEIGGRTIRIVTKAGGFGGSDLFARIADLR